MEKQKKWPFILIVTVIALTLYNIFPTIFYYTQPLKSPINEKQSLKISESIAQRVNRLETESKSWLASYCQQLHLSPQSIESSGQNFILRFTKSDEASKFRKFFPRAGSLISFAPAQLALAPQEDNPKEVVIQRKISQSLEPSAFSYAPQGSPLYREVILDRVGQVAYALAGPSESSYALASLSPHHLDALALQIQSIADLAETHKPLANRLASHFAQGPFSNKGAAVQSLISAFEKMRDELKKDPKFEKRRDALLRAESYLKKHEPLFSTGPTAWTLPEIRSALQEKNALSFSQRNPLFSGLEIDWENAQIHLKLHPDIAPEKIEQWLINESAKVQRLTGENLTVREGRYSISLHKLSDFSNYLVLNLESLAQAQADQLTSAIKANWHPQHPDLQSLKLVSASAYDSLSPEEKALCLILHLPGETYRSLTLIAKGIEPLLKHYEAFPESEPAQTFSADFRSLGLLLAQSGFQGFQGPNQELIFQKPDLFHSLLMTTREDFIVKGSQKYALLELSNLEQRLLTENKIDTQIHEELIKWKDEYNAAQVSVYPAARFDVPKPTRDPFLSNLLLSWKKYFRGDEKRVIHWGLDLSGGKTVQVELRDAQNQVVKGDEEIKQAINELYRRVNKMGVSEVAIRQLGTNIVLDFPGSQSLSASELIKASTMVFHVVNEKFSSPSSPLAASSQRFLQEVWNEALVTQRQDAQSIQSIAWKHLHGENLSEAAKTLRENGLILANPDDASMNSSLDESISKVALIRAEHWFGQSHPLLFVFRNFALEGSHLDRVLANYDAQRGNYLSFEVRGNAEDRKGQKFNPRDVLQTWTTRFSKEKVLGTPLEDYSNGHGWRMAVLLNDTVISAPTLDAVIRDSASISGSFSQREVNQLVADLKAGSLSFTPHILSEKNVSPELGQKDRTQGILATGVALLLVIASMVAYYRFAGVVASAAVLFNLLILWATLQNMGATLSLAGIAGIILTVGMAIDANVLVFERVKEEFAVTKNIASAIAAGYKKAYSAIVDSNVTTLIAALILLNFDAGPIKGFAITLIIGIVSSMFTALFMTRFYFDRWLRNPKHTALSMANWIRAHSIDFLKPAKLAFALAFAIILAGSYFVFVQRSTLFGMDFTGGFSLELEVEPNREGNYLHSVEKALAASGATHQDFQIRELNPTNQLRVLFGTSMEQPGKPFYNMPLETETFTNPRIDWVVQTLQTHGLSLTKDSLEHLPLNWTAMSGQMSDSMRNNALIGLLISFVCIFIYIAFRFEYKFAAASIICLLHDVLITLGLMALLHAVGVPVQIDLNTVAAIMTIVGYSLNDTIIIFDRIREEIRLHPRNPLSALVNQALNATLSRTTITSGTTLLVLIALVAFGSASIFSFALVMTIGVFFGTLSSWYIASPLMLFFHNLEQRQKTEIGET